MELDARERRRARAATVGAAYAANPNVAAVLLAGSVARGLADDASDIEVDVFWRVPPTDDERRAPWSTNCWRLVASDVDEHEWADSFVVEGIKVDTSQFLVETLDGWIDLVVQYGDTEPEYQVRITAIRDGEVLHGSALIEGWRARTDVYPDVLRHAMVDQGLDVWPRARLEMLAARDDVLLLHSDLVDNVQRLLDALMGLNRRYAPHPFHKWLDWEASLLVTSPVDLSKRVRHLLTAPPTAAVDEISALVEETFDLVDHQLSDYDTAPKRAAHGLRRVLPESPLGHR